MPLFVEMHPRVPMRRGVTAAECPQVKHRRKCTHLEPILRHSSQPFALGVTSRTIFRCGSTISSPSFPFRRPADRLASRSCTISHLSEGMSTPNFLMINAPAFGAPDAKSFLSVLKLVAATTERGEGLKKAYPRSCAVSRGLSSRSGKEAVRSSHSGILSPIPPGRDTLPKFQFCTVLIWPSFRWRLSGQNCRRSQVLKLTSRVDRTDYEKLSKASLQPMAANGI
jgi:hypothetical protein